MMAEQHCIYPARESVLVAYLYGDDIDAADRVAFETHLAICERCRIELADFRDVRSSLGQWAAPESAERPQSPVSNRPSRWWHEVPVWAQVAAALLVLGVSASIANLDIRYDGTRGLSVRTGWSKAEPAPSVAVVPAANVNATPWRADLAAMREDLRKEMRTPTTTVTMSDEEFRRRVLPMLDESEQKQKTMLARQLLQLQSDVFAQEQADISKIHQQIGLVQSNANSEINKVRAAFFPGR
jgi:hypothetical protein